MKKFVLLLITASFSLIVSAQSWKEEKHIGDELLGTEDYSSYEYNEGNFSFIFWSNKDDDFRICTLEQFFEYDGCGASGNHIFNAIIGYYDIDNNLIDKNEKFVFELDSNGTPNYAHPNKYTRMGGNNKKAARKVIEYLNKQKGYVRIVASLYGTKINFDLKIKCLNNQ